MLSLPTYSRFNSMVPGQVLVQNGSKIWLVLISSPRMCPCKGKVILVINHFTLPDEVSVSAMKSKDAFEFNNQIIFFLDANQTSRLGAICDKLRRSELFNNPIKYDEARQKDVLCEHVRRSRSRYTTKFKGMTEHA